MLILKFIKKRIVLLYSVDKFKTQKISTEF